MFVYTVGYKSVDGAKVIEITHDRQISPAELEALVSQVLPEAARKHIAALADKERKRGQVPDDLFDACFIPHITFNHVYKHVVELLIERHGFKRLEYAASLTVFSVPDLLVRGDAAGDPDGDDDLQARLSEVLAQAGLPVETAEEREAHEEAKIAALAPIRRERRAQRAVARFKATGHNPFKTEDVLLVKEMLSQLAERPLDEAEAARLDEILPALLEVETAPVPDDLAQQFLAYEDTQALAVLLGAELPQEAPEESLPQESADEPQSLAEEDGTDEPVDEAEETPALSVNPESAE